VSVTVPIFALLNYGNYFFQYGGRLPFCSCFASFTCLDHEDYVVAFIVTQNLVGIDTVVYIIGLFEFDVLLVSLGNAYSSYSLRDSTHKWGLWRHISESPIGTSLHGKTCRYQIDRF